MTEELMMAIFLDKSSLREGIFSRQAILQRSLLACALILLPRKTGQLVPRNDDLITEVALRILQIHWRFNDVLERLLTVPAILKSLPALRSRNASISRTYGK